MSPQFVDFDADGRLDIVAGIYDGSPHLVRGTAEGWAEPEQILDKDGQRIVLNHFWNFDTKKWDDTTRCNPKDADGKGHGHITSAVAMDLDGDGDLDLLLGDHRSGHVYQRVNEGTAKEPRYATTNEVVHAGGAPIDVPGTVATLRLCDWNKDGLLDLAAGSMGDAYGDGEGGGVYLFLNTGSKQETKFAAPLTLLANSKKGQQEPTRPDIGLYMDFADHEGDGDLDMIVGGYSMWTPKAPVLNEQQKARAAELQQQIADAEKAAQDFMAAIEKAVEGLEEAAADKKRGELWAQKQDEYQALHQKQQKLQQELDPLVPGQKRVAYVWLYENLGTTEKAPATPR